MVSTPNLRQNLFLIGNLDTQIYGNKLPSKLQVLKILFFNIRVVKLTLRESAALVVSEVKIFWDKARLPIQKTDRCINKVETLYKEWSILNNHRTRPANLEKEQAFVSSLKNLFDIAHGDVYEHVDERRKQFLENQRLEGRVGFINDVEGYFENMERDQERRKEIELQRYSKYQSDINLIGKIHDREKSLIELAHLVFL